MSSNAKKSGTADRSDNNEEEPRMIVANYVLREDLVHVVSSQTFYLKQMQWCVESINDFWNHIVHVRRGVMPNVVPMALRFCISWLTGNDCTNWNAREVCRWLQHNVGNDITPMYITWRRNNNVHRVMDPSGRPAVYTPLRMPTITLPPPQFLFPAMEPPEDADASAAAVDVGSSETVERVDGTAGMPTITLSPPQFPFPAMQTPGDADASAAAVDVGSSETAERADDTTGMPTITLPPPQFLFPAMQPSEDADVSSAALDVGTSETPECADDTHEDTKK